MVIAVLEMTMPRGNEAVTIGALRAFWDSTCALPGCVGGGVFQEAGAPGTALYIEMWQETAQLETHIRSREYHRLLAIMETAAAPPALRFNFVTETRGLAWVEQLRLGDKGARSQ
jgi:quinol monooxygenase YgiN